MGVSIVIVFVIFGEVLYVVGGVFATLFLLTAYQFVRDSMLGNSEAMLAALAPTT